MAPVYKGFSSLLQNEGAWVNISPVGVAEVVFAVSVFCNSPKASEASKKTLNYLFAILQWGACFIVFFGVLGDFWAFFWSEFLVPFWSGFLVLFLVTFLVLFFDHFLVDFLAFAAT
jgi:hypothetical protein